MRIYKNKILDIIVKILLTLIYPIWFFLSKTWIGNLIMLPVIVLVVPFLISILLPNLLLLRGDEAQSVGIGMGLLALICSPFVGTVFLLISDFLEYRYREWRYYTNKMEDTLEYLPEGRCRLCGKGEVLYERKQWTGHEWVTIYKCSSCKKMFI